MNQPRFVMAARAALKVLRDGEQGTSGEAISACFAAILAELHASANMEIDREHADRLVALVLRETAHKTQQAIRSRPANE